MSYGCGFCRGFKALYIALISGIMVDICGTQSTSLLMLLFSILNLNNCVEIDVIKAIETLSTQVRNSRLQSLELDKKINLENVTAARAEEALELTNFVLVG